MTPESKIFKGADFPSNVALVFMKWNLPFSKTQNGKTAKGSTRPFVLHNVRAESLVGPMAKASLNLFKRQYHCIIIANGYYEWQQQGRYGARKVPYYFRRKDGKLCYFAGLYGCPSGKYKN